MATPRSPALASRLLISAPAMPRPRCPGSVATAVTQATASPPAMATAESIGRSGCRLIVLAQPGPSIP